MEKDPPKNAKSDQDDDDTKLAGATQDVDQTNSHTSSQRDLLRTRAVRCRNEARLILSLIVPLLGVAAYIFAEAVPIARSEVSEAQQGNVIATLNFISREIEKLRELESSTGELSFQNKEYFDSLRTRQSRVLDALQSGGNTQDSSSTPIIKDVTITTLVQTNITRFGTLAIVIFAATILVGIYRYNIRLSVLYDFQADMCAFVSAGNISKQVFADVTTSLPAADFGKTPSTPVESIMDTIKKAKDLAGKSKE